jgi:hypothetical protein
MAGPGSWPSRRCLVRGGRRRGPRCTRGRQTGLVAREQRALFVWLRAMGKRSVETLPLFRQCPSRRALLPKSMVVRMVVMEWQALADWPGLLRSRIRSPFSRTQLGMEAVPYARLWRRVVEMDYSVIRRKKSRRVVPFVSRSAAARADMKLCRQPSGE